MISSNSFVIANEPHVAAKVMDGEAILINITTGAYYSMAGVGGFIWSEIERGAAVDDIVRAVLAQYEVEMAQAEADVLALCAQLRDEELVKIASVGTASGGVSAAPAMKLAYQTPALEKFTDMAEMFALDPPLPGLAATSARSGR